MIIKNDITKYLSLIIFIIGINVLLYPTIIDEFNKETHENFITSQMDLIKNDMEQEIQKQESENNNVNNNTDNKTENNEPIKDKPLNKYDLLYKDLKEYNEYIYETGQSKLLDPFMFETTAISLEDYDIPSEIFGYITIPAMDIELPIYLGATKANMKKGAAYLATTSYPIGGNNTNSVICAHRGMSSQAMFRNIERIKVGDKITITNIWETLTYKVVDTEVIRPEDIEKIFIQEGKDMLTLSTCHPYRHNYQRYIVYCERIPNEEITEEK